MKTIAVIGANGQVGSEVCLFLDQRSDVRPIAVCRSARASALLERYGIECRLGRIDDSQTARALLDDCDLVVDFSLPKGRLGEIRLMSERIIGSAIGSAPPGTPFVYISSYMALGMHGENAVARQHLIPRTPYAAAKRHGERVALRLGRLARKHVYVLRLGQVYGELQTVSRMLMEEVTDAPALIPDCASYSVFAFTIAEALANITAGLERPGRYTVVSFPEWSWREIYEYYCARRGVRPAVTLAPIAIPTFRSALKQAVGGLAVLGANRIISLANSLANRHRDMLAANLLWRATSLEGRILADYRTRRARAEINTLKSQSLYKPFRIFVGQVQGDRLRSLSDSRITMEPAAQQVRARLAHLLV